MIVGNPTHKYILRISMYRVVRYLVIWYVIFEKLSKDKSLISRSSKHRVGK